MYSRHDVSPGPGRWARAQRNAEANPHTKAAKLYRDRTAFADLIVHDSNLPDVPYEHMQREYKWDNGRIDLGMKRKHATCSLRCAALQIQLQHGTQQYDRAVEILAGEPLDSQWNPVPWAQNRPLDLTSIKRMITCYVCAKKIEPAGSSEPAAATPVIHTVTVTKDCEREHVERTSYIVTGIGTMTKVEDARVIEVTAREFEILAVYSTAELVQAFAVEHGKTVVL